MSQTDLEQACRRGVRKYLTVVTGEPPSKEQVDDYIDSTEYCESYVSNYKDSVTPD